MGKTRNISEGHNEVSHENLSDRVKTATRQKAASYLEERFAGAGLERAVHDTSLLNEVVGRLDRRQHALDGEEGGQVGGVRSWPCPSVCACVRLAVYVEMRINVKNHHELPAMRPDNDLIISSV